MEEVVNTGAIEEIATPQATESPQEPLQKVIAEEDSQEKNWRELRRSRDELERKAKLQEELLQRLMTQQQAHPGSVPPQIEEDILSELAKEDYASGEKVAKSLRKIEEKYEKKLADIESKYKSTAYNDKIAKLRQKNSDLDDVVNLDTLKLYAEQNPDIAETWQGKDDYTIYVQAYPLIKSSGILDQMKGVRRAKDVEKKIEENKKTVQSPQAFDKRPMAQAFDYNRLSDSQKEDLQKEMYYYASLSGGY